MKRRKHRVVVEVTLERPDTEKRAVQLIQLAINGGTAKRTYVGDFITTWEAKSWSRTIAYMVRKIKPKHYRDYWR